MATKKTEPPRGVLRVDDDPTGVVHERFHPAPAHREHIEHHWSVRWDRTGRAPFRAETLPHPSFHMVVDRDGACRVQGVHTSRFVTTLPDRGRVFGVKFRPGCFFVVVDVAASEFSERSVAASRVFGVAAIRGYARDVVAAAGAADSAVVADDFFVGRLPPLPAAVRALRDVVERLARDPALRRVEDVAAVAGVDVRTLQRRCRAVVGVSPKWILQRYRLHEAAERLLADPGVDLAALALELGYADQAHFSRDFAAFADRAPARYARALMSRASPAKRRR